MDSSSSSTNQRRMRSGAVVLGGMGLLAATLVACGNSNEPDRRCVDRTTLDKLDDKHCKGSSSSSRGTYYYGGSVRNGKVSGGSFDKSAVTRGGIGGHSSSGSSGG
ncbi:hypothetical protein OG429_23520 [Streptomyces sp. NBC_00190]|uniref:hypothetical protein n=1 Tax=unclassified Streptomyces TaxID=2593676 RepID=UPI002E2AEA68|nr:hypothetical protein [Streptomyces sp. NBC_00190]WSZ42000.1 hypothetical protein OG239_26295 [Streptomyces sp. NBC_00868]